MTETELITMLAATGGTGLLILATVLVYLRPVRQAVVDRIRGDDTPPDNSNSVLGTNMVHEPVEDSEEDSMRFTARRGRK